jgi:hypothetical protein
MSGTLASSKSNGMRWMAPLAKLPWSGVTATREFWSHVKLVKLLREPNDARAYLFDHRIERRLHGRSRSLFLSLRAGRAGNVVGRRRRCFAKESDRYRTSERWLLCLCDATLHVMRSRSQRMLRFRPRSGAANRRGLGVEGTKGDRRRRNWMEGSRRRPSCLLFVCFSGVPRR